MKRKIYSLLVATFVFCASGSLAVSAKTATATPETTAAIETTTQANESDTITPVADKPTAPTVTVKASSIAVKVNSISYCHKALEIKKSTLQKNYNLVSRNPKVATVTEDGTVKGIKKGSTTITLTSKKTGQLYATISVKVKKCYTKKELRLMSAIIYAEAGGECYAGKKAVGVVVMNRVKSNQFPNTLKGVIYDPYQFGPVKNGSLKKALKRYDKGKMNKKCIKAAKATLNGDTMVTYKKVTTDMSGYLFFSGYVSGKRLQIQGHQFK